MVPDFRRDDVWAPAAAGATAFETSYEIKQDSLRKMSKTFLLLRKSIDTLTDSFPV
jgi:hypothetical protein